MRRGVLVTLLALATAVAVHQEATAVAGSVARRAPTLHREYVFEDGSIWVYDIDRAHRLVQQIPLPQAQGVRGVGVGLPQHTLYVSYGGDGGLNGNGSLLAFDLLRKRVLWTKTYDTGVDSFAITPDGRTIYMPTGELSPGNQWLVINARTGALLGSLSGGTGPHNTVIGPRGKFAYLGGRNSPYLYVASTSTRRVVKQVGPLQSGVRPFTVNSAETLAFTTATGVLGFQMSSLVTGKVLFTVGFKGFSYDPSRFDPSAPSHGISLSPDGRELYVIDGPNSYVHVFAINGPSQAPSAIADIKLAHPLTGLESPCAYDCVRNGWLQHSSSGRYVYVGDSGDVIDTRTKRIVAFLPALDQTRKMLEIDWRLGLPVATTTRTGVGPVRE
jgi:DNA-binding beta-propeller fold protein YncE